MSSRKSQPGSRRPNITDELEAAAETEEQLIAEARRKGPRWLQSLRKSEDDTVDAQEEAEVDALRGRRSTPRTKAPRGASQGKTELGRDSRRTDRSSERTVSDRARPAAKRHPNKTKPPRPTVKEDGNDLDGLLDKLQKIRMPLYKELRKVMKALRQDPSAPDPHHCCEREFNQMRITDLEALSIARAFRDEPHLRRRLPAVKRRIEEEQRHLKKSRRRQNFTCPLLDGDKCLVHQAAKPIGCLAFNADKEPSEAGWKILNSRNRYNDRMVDRPWDLQAIPLMLAKYIDGEELEPGKIRVHKSKNSRAKTIRAKARRGGPTRRGEVARRGEASHRGRVSQRGSVRHAGSGKPQYGDDNPGGSRGKSAKKVRRSRR